MFLRCNRRKKDGKTHCYWSLVESERLSKNKVIQRQVLYLGEINSSQKKAWRKTIDVIEKGAKQQAVRQMSLFPDGHETPIDDDTIVQVKLSELSVQRPRQYGACWLADQLWQRLGLDSFWRSRLEISRKGTDWMNVLKTQTAYSLISGGSEWKLHRRWYGTTAMGDLLGEDYSLVQKDKLYRCLDKLVEHKDGLFKHLQKRWKSLFGASFDVLLYDLTSTYFECDPPEEGIKRYGYSRDKRGDCVQVVIALIVTPQGFPLTYEVMPGNTADSSTLRDFLKRIETLYGRVNRTWIMDRGIPTEETLSEMRRDGVNYLVGTPKGRLTSLEKHFVGKPWQEVRDALKVRLHQDGDELYALVKSEKRVCKEQAMRRRRFRNLWKGLKALQARKPKLYTLLQRVGALKAKAGRVAGLVTIHLPEPGEPVNEETFRFEVNRKKMKAWRRKEGRYLLRSNLVDEDPAKLWSHYMQLTEVEQAFKELKHDLNVRPIYHQKDSRVEAHIFVAFLAYCLNVTLKNMLKAKAPGLTAKDVLEQMAEIKMVDVHLPTVDGREIVLPRYTKPEKNHEVILHVLGMELPRQPKSYVMGAEGSQEGVSAAGKAMLKKLGFEAKPASAQPQNRKNTRARKRTPISKSVRQMKRTRCQICSGDLWHRAPAIATHLASRPP